MASTRAREAVLIAALVSCAVLAPARRARGVERLELETWAAESLERNGFVVVPGDEQDFAATYRGLSESAGTFISSDVVLHRTASVIDGTLAALETGEVYSRLVDLSRELVRLSEEQYLLASDPVVKETARLNMAYFAVGLSLLDPDYFPSEFVRNLVERELALIEVGDAMAMSPILGPTPLDSVAGPGEDYSKYVPRGRYADGDRAARLYRAVTWYGRMAFALPEGRVADYGLTRQALLIVRALESEAGEWLELWERVDEPLRFFYGDSGDPTVTDYADISRDVFGEEFDIELVADDELVADFAERVAEMAPAHFETHELRGMRFLGRRHSPDTPFLYRLARASERPLPTMLDIVALLDSSVARALLVENEDAFDDDVYRNGFEELQDHLDALTYADWTRDLHWSWLYALRSLADGPEVGASGFVAGDAWDAKTLSTAAAGWTLLRRTWTEAAHGTAGQAPTGEAAAGPVLVEPCPALYERLGELTENLRDRLLENDLLGRDIAADLAEHASLLSLLEARAREDPGEPAADGQRSGSGSRAAARAASASGRPSGPQLVARLCTGLGVSFSTVAYIDHGSGRLLEVALGRPDVIYVLEDGPGGRTVYAGAVLSFYEFERETGSRSGADWGSLVEGGGAKRPAWVGRFLVD